MTRTRRVLEVLSQFSEKNARLTAVQIAERLGVGRATAYRCIADLEAEGLLERTSGSAYVLGPAIVELDRAIRLSDPLIVNSTPVMRSLAARVGGRVLLCRVHGRKVLCVHDEAGANAPESVSYERGRAMSLYRGATSRVILCNLSKAQLLRLTQEDTAGLMEARLPTDVEQLNQRLSEDRHCRVYRSSGAVDQSMVGWAVPLWQGEQLLGSLSVVMERRYVCDRSALIEDSLLRSGLRIEGRISGV